MDFARSRRALALALVALVALAALFFLAAFAQKLFAALFAFARRRRGARASLHARGR